MSSKNIKTKEEIIEILNLNCIPYNIIKCCDCETFCIPLCDDPNYCRNTAIIVQTANKDICKVHPCEILYIAIENRRSVLYLSDKKIETSYPLIYWKGILDEKVFMQPHYSYIVNLNYVDEVTKDFVKIKCAGKEYSVYTSARKITAFKRAMLKLQKK